MMHNGKNISELQQDNVQDLSENPVNLPTANSQQPTANSQQPTANSQQPTANSQQPTVSYSQKTLPELF